MILRPRSDFQVQSLIRTVQGLGGFATVRHRGHEIAGVIHLVIAENTNQFTVFCATYDDEGALSWRPSLESVADEEVDRFFEKERAFDCDLWVVDIEGGVRIKDLG